MIAPDPTPTTPASAPIGAVLAAAAVAAIQAVIPLSNGVQPNYALMAATFLVVFGSTLAMALYHVQVPSPVQQVATAQLSTALQNLTTLHPVHIPAVLFQPQPVANVGAVVQPATVTPTPAAVSTDVPTHA